MKSYSYSRWALKYRPTGYLLGKYAWQNAAVDDLNIRTFSTRKAARAAKDVWWGGDVEPVKVTVTIIVSP